MRQMVGLLVDGGGSFSFFFKADFQVVNPPYSKELILIYLTN